MSTNNVHFSSQRMDWNTPKAVLQTLDAEFNFTFDPAMPNYKELNFDGLIESWGSCNFVNPPYGRQIGKVQTSTSKAVDKWKDKQQPNYEGYFQCYICGKWIDYLMAEHVKSKARSPESRTDPDNFKPTCSSCNKAKGSKSFA